MNAQPRRALDRTQRLLQANPISVIIGKGALAKHPEKGLVQAAEAVSAPARKTQPVAYIDGEGSPWARPAAASAKNPERLR
jgi:hypothetical protein